MRADLHQQDQFPNGTPKPIFVIKGRRLYDPRLDSTAGGSGSHRLDDESTWEYSNNAALVAYDYMRGIYITGDDDVPRRVAGLGMPDYLIDLEWVIASANVCDERGWTINGPFLAGSDPADMLTSFEQHMGGRIVTRAGKIAIIAGDDWPSVDTITENDLAGKITITYAKEWRQVHNSVRATYRDASDDGNYETVETNPINVPSWEEQDGQRFETSISLPFVTDQEQATKLSKVWLYRQRKPRTITLSVKLSKSRIYEGDFVDLELPSYGISETYEVTGWTLDQSGFAELTLEQWVDGVFDWASEEAGDPPSFGKVERTNFAPPLPDSEDWTVTGETLSTSSGTLPGVLVTGTAPSWLDGVLIEWRVDGDTYWTAWNESPPAIAGAFITGLAPNEDYQISISYRFADLISDRLTFNVTTPNSFYAATSGVASSITGQGSLATRSDVLAEHINASDTSNMVSDASLLSASAWQLGSGWTFGTTDTEVTTTLGAARGLRTESGNGTTSQTNTQTSYPSSTTKMTIEPGCSYRASVKALVKSGYTGQVALQVRFGDRTGALITSTTIQSVSYMTTPAASDITHNLAGVVIAPANAYYAQFRVLANWSTTQNNAGRAYYAVPALRRIGVLNESIVRQDGSTLLTDAAAVTSLGTAAAITGQGSLATRSDVLSQHVNVGDPSNMISDSDFLSSAAWTLGSGWTFGSTDSQITTSLGAARGLRTVAGNGTTSQAASQTNFPNATTKLVVEPGKPHRISVASYVPAGFTGAIELYARYGTRDGTLISATVIDFADYRTTPAASATVETLAGITVPPSNAYYVQYRLQVQWSTTQNNSGSAYFAKPSLRRIYGLNDSVVREDGSTLLTDAAAVTSLGTAAAITGQGVGATANSLEDLDSDAAEALASLIAGTASPGGSSASNSGVIGSSSTTWLTVAYVDVAIPAGGFAYLQSAQIVFTNGVATATAGIRLLETDTSDVGSTVHFSTTQFIGIDEPVPWEAPATWSDKITPDARGETRRFKLQINRTSGTGTVTIGIQAGSMSAAVW
jgi:hypothetical protein